MSGYQTFFAKKNLIQVFSVPNYAYRVGNTAAFVRVNEFLEREVTYFEEAEENRSTKYSVRPNDKRNNYPRFR